MHRATLFLCTILAATLAAACHEELGIGEAPGGERLEVAEVSLTGVEQLEESRLKGVMRTRSSSWLPWADPEYFDRSRFEQDLDRIVSLYHQEGFPDAEIASYNVDLAPDGGELSIAIDVDEGEPIVVTALELEGFDTLPAAAVQDLRDRLPIAEGRRLTLSAEAQAVTISAQTFQNHGYPDPEVSSDRIEEAPRRVRVVVRANPGETASFGEVAIVGNARVSENVVRRQLTYAPGDPFSRDALVESRRRITSLNLFRFVTVDVLDEQSDPAQVATRVTVAEGEPRELNFSVGYGTEEKLGAEASWEHLNFFGAARTVGVRGKWSSLDRGGEVRFTQPYVFRSDLSMSLRGRNWYVDEPAFRALSRGGRGALTWAPSSRFSATASLVNEFTRSTVSDEALADPSLHDELIALGLNPVTGRQEGTLGALELTLEWRTTADVLNPKQGYVLSATAEQAGGWMHGSFNYRNVLAEGRAYQTLGGITFAERVRAGSIDPIGPPSDVPFFKRYFLGGSTSLRGWGRFEVAPLSDLGLPIGGHSLFETSLETRFPVTEKLSGVVFVDAGNVSRDPWDFKVNDLLWDAGPGVRYDTPFGPIRLDVAYQLNQLEGLRIGGAEQRRRWRVHFSIGQAF